MLRATLLFLSRQRWLRALAERHGFGDSLVRRFIAGETLDDAIAVSHQLAKGGHLVTLDRLGENVTSAVEADSTLQEYVDALARIENEGLPSTISIKLTQLGLDLDDSECEGRALALCERARQAETHVEFDMESSAYTDRTLQIVEAAHLRGGNVRAVIQAYLRRSERDIERLNRLKIPVRLCKGAYSEPPEIAFPSKKDVDANYRALMRRLLESGTRPALATHDAAIVKDAIDDIRRLGLTQERFEFQMLYGIRRDLQRRILKLGYGLRLYIPYGTAWYPYFMRRLAERPANVWFLARNIFRG